MSHLRAFEYDDPEPTGISRVFLSHPEINALAIGKRLGIDRNAMVQYVNGTKKPTMELESRMMKEIQNVARELEKATA